MKEFTIECKTHEIATNLTAFLNSIPNVKAEDLGGIIKITVEEKEKLEEEKKLEDTE